MNKKIIIPIYLFILFTALFGETGIGINRLYSDFKKLDPVYHSKIEDVILSSLSITAFDKKYALNSYKRSLDVDKFIASWKKHIQQGDASADKFEKENSEILDEIGILDMLICMEVDSFVLSEEKDFYDTNITNYRLDIKIRFSVFDIKKKVMTDENVIEIDLISKKGFNEVKDQSFYFIAKKTDSVFEEISNYNRKIFPVSIGKTIIRFDKGKDAGLKPGNILIYNQTGEYAKTEHTVVRIISVGENDSTANIIYTKGGIPDEAEFIRRSGINMELQLGGGFVISLPQNQNPFLYGSADVRLLIPTGIVFFNPVVHFEFNFFYLARLENSAMAGSQGRLFLPFSIETGVQGKYNVHRFEFSGGFMAGVLFSPDENNVYRVDAPSLRPYIHLASLISANFNLFAEFGYRYYVEDSFSKNWKTDLKGMYLSFGLGVDF